MTVCEESTPCYLGLYVSDFLSVCTKDGTSSDLLFKLLKFVENITESIDDTWEGWNKQLHTLYGAGEDWYPQSCTASSLSVISDVNTQHRGGTGCLQSDHRGCYSSTIFGSSVCHSQSGSSPTDPSLKAFSHHPSQSDMALPPTAPKGSVSFKPPRWLLSPGYTASHTHLQNNRVRKKEKKICTNWDSHLFDPFSSCKSSATMTVSSQKQTLFFSDMTFKMKRLLALKY